MLSKSVEEALNRQLKHEADSSQIYLAMASWAETQPGLQGVTEFFYAQSEEERQHMLKLMVYINERGRSGIVSALEQPTTKFPSLIKVFQEFMKNEIGVSESINDIVHLTLQEKDYATYNFLQWYVAEQIEEERLARTLNEKLELIGSDKGGMYLFDRDIVSYRATIGRASRKELS